MKILILGGTGAMGVHLVDILSQNAGNEIFVTTRKTHSAEKENVSYIMGDAKNMEFISSVLVQGGWDIIVDFMMYSTEEFKSRADLFLSSCKQYVFLSSSRVYADSKVPITENSPRLLEVCNDETYLSTDEYALSKARQENILFENKKKNWTIIRPYITYSENRLQLGVLEKECWLFTVLNCGVLVFSEDIAQHTTTLTHGYDVARGIAAVIGNDEALGEAFHITGDTSIKWQEVFDLYAKVLKENGVDFEKILKEKTHRLESAESRYQVIYDRYFDRVFDNSKIARFIDVKSFAKPSEGLENCLREFLKNPKFNYTSVGGGHGVIERNEEKSFDSENSGHKAEDKIPSHKNASISLLRRVYRKGKRAIKKAVRRFGKITPVYVPVLEGNLLEGRAALITGGTSGIGFAIAESFLKNGASVVITGRSLKRVMEVCKSIEDKDSCFKGKINGIEMDSKDVKSFEFSFENALSFCGGKIDILVNNAGISKGSFEALTEEDFDSVFDTNLKGAYFLSRIFAKYMKDKNIRGNILNVASSSSLRPAVSPYTLTKWGLRGFTLGLAKILSPYGIVVNAIAPGPTATPMLTDCRDDLRLSTSPQGRYATAEEIANLATVLVSDMGRMVVGDTLYATGGAGLITFDDMKYEF